MGDVQDDDGASVLIDPVANTLVRSAAGGILPGILILQQMADAVRVLQQWAGEELGRSRRDFLGQPRELALSARPDVEIPAAGAPGHAAPASWNRWAKRRRNSVSSRPGPSSPSPGSSPESARSAVSRRHHAVASADSSSSSRCHSSADTSTIGLWPGRLTATGPRPASTSSAAAASRSASLCCSLLTPLVCRASPLDGRSRARSHKHTSGLPACPDACRRFLAGPFRFVP